MALLLLLSVPAGAELSLGELRVKFEDVLEKETTEYSGKMEKLRTGYAGALERLKVTLGREGKLEDATQVLSELDNLEAGGEVEPLPEKADYRFKRLRNTWEEEQARLTTAHRRKVLELADVYLEALGNRKAALTRAGSIRKALVVEEEMKRVNELPKIVEFRSADADAEKEDAGPSEREVTRMLTGTLWSYARPGQAGEQVTVELRFTDKREATFGGNFVVQWKILPDLTLRLTQEGSDAEAIYKLDKDLETFEGKGLDGAKASARRLGPLNGSK